MTKAGVDPGFFGGGEPLEKIGKILKKLEKNGQNLEKIGKNL